MATSQPLTAEALVKLGPERLAALLLDAAEHDAALARTLRVAVASQAGATAAAVEIDAEIKRLKRGTSFIDRHRVPDFVRGLSALHDAITGPLADADPEMALERIFDFIDLAPTLIDRTDDDGQIADVMRSTCIDAAELAARASSTFPSERSAFRAYQTYLCDDYGTCVRGMRRCLGIPRLEQIQCGQNRSLLARYSRQPARRPIRIWKFTRAL
jgi:hypothetical protein